MAAGGEIGGTKVGRSEHRRFRPKWLGLSFFGWQTNSYFIAGAPKTAKVEVLVMRTSLIPHFLLVVTLGQAKNLYSLSWKTIHKERVEETWNAENDPVSEITSQDLTLQSSEASWVGSWIQTPKFNNPMRRILHGFVFILWVYLYIWTPQLPVTMNYRIWAWQKKASSHLVLKYITPKIHRVLHLIARGSCSFSLTSSPLMNFSI